MQRGAAIPELVTIIAALDEEVHIGRVIGSVSALGQVFVVDGGSHDRTRGIAEEAGASVVERAWDGYANQKNWALENLAQDASWVLSLDADEWLTPELRSEISQAIASDQYAGYYVPRWNIFLGRMLKHAWWYPDYQLRLFRPDRGRYEDRLVHEQVQVDGEVGFIKSPLMHENLKGIDAFVDRHIRYAELEAREMLKAKREGLGTQRRGSFFGSYPERRRALKLQVWYRLPARPAIRFLWMYLIKRGFLDGREGRVYCELIASQEAFVNAKLLELEQALDSSGRG